MIEKDDVERIIKNYLRENLTINITADDYDTEDRKLELVLVGEVIHTEWFTVG